MKKILLLVFIFSNAYKVHSNPVEVANNIFNEFQQVIEIINQLEELREQLQARAEMLNNLSGSKEYIISLLEQELRNWHPEGEEIYDPGLSSDPDSYNFQFNEIEQSLDLFDLVELYDLANENDTNNEQYPMFKASDNFQKMTIASAAYGKTLLSQGTDRNQLISDYLNLVEDAESLKDSTDIQTQIIAQSVYQQIEINKSIAMLLQLKSAQSQKKLVQERWYHNLLRKREDQ